MKYMLVILPKFTWTKERRLLKRFSNQRIKVAMEKLTTFKTINLVYALCLFQVLSTMQHTRVSWALSVSKTAPWRNSRLQKFGNVMLYCLEFISEAPTRRDPCIWVSRQRILSELDDFKGDYKSTAAQKLHSIRFDKKTTSKFIGEIQAMIDNDPSKSIRSIAWDMGVAEFLIKQVVHEDFCYFSYKMRKSQFFPKPWKTRRKAML